ncbi:MAG: glycosyltransferase family 87 protein [Flavobacteriaceae bacterium]
MDTTKTHLRWILPLFLLIGFYFEAYDLERTHTLPLLSLFSLLFILLWFWIRHFSTLTTIFILGIIIRFLFIYHIPSLSQDFYRFIWDGNIQLLGINPYLDTPNTLIKIIDFPNASLLYERMGGLSAGHYSNYPPVSQYLYQLMAFFNNEGILAPVLALRIVFFTGDLILFFVGIRLLTYLGKDSENIAWYFLNPLVIIEGIGNLHGESFMICFTLIALLLLIQKKSIWGGFFFSIAIATKLIPLLIAPLFFRYLGFRNFVVFGLSTLLFSILIWFPFWEGEMITHYKQTLDLWFTTFEFNGSIYKIVRAIGYEVKGYNIIRQLGKVTPFITLAMVALFALIPSNRSSKSLFKSMLFLLSCYFFMATTVHPWYLINLIILGILTGYAFPILWSLTVFWSYSAYGITEVKEVSFLQWASYLLVYGCFIWELLKGPLGQHLHKPNLFGVEHSPISSR